MLTILAASSSVEIGSSNQWRPEAEMILKKKKQTKRPEALEQRAKDETSRSTTSYTTCKINKNRGPKMTKMPLSLNKITSAPLQNRSLLSVCRLSSVSSSHHLQCNFPAYFSYDNFSLFPSPILSRFSTPLSGLFSSISDHPIAS